MPTAWKDRKRPTMRGTRPIAPVELEVIELANASAKRQGLSRSAYIASLVCRDAGRSSGIGAPLWQAAVLPARVLSLVSFAAISNERGNESKVATLIGETRATLGAALTTIRAPLADPSSDLAAAWPQPDGTRTRS